MSRIESKLLVILFLLSLTASVYAQSDIHYPEIQSLESKKANIIFRQFLDDVSDSYKRYAAGIPLQPAFYRYIATSHDNLFSLSSRCSLPVETIALLNHLPSADSPIAGKTLYLPVCAGLYLSASPTMFIETLLALRFEGQELTTVNCGGETFYFVPGERLTGTERLYFLDSRLTSPLEQSVLTSSFGSRISPITGKESFHHGIDLAAPLHSPVFACLSGQVYDCGNDDIYGNYVILNHDNNLQSLYAHLDRYTVRKGDMVAGSSVIGYVGVTGLTTGPHLHFEVRQNGVLLDPEDFLKQ